MMETEPDCGILIYQRTATLPSLQQRRKGKPETFDRTRQACVRAQYLWCYGQAQRAKDQWSIVSNLRGVLTNEKRKRVAKNVFYAFFLIHRFNTLFGKLRMTTHTVWESRTIKSDITWRSLKAVSRSSLFSIGAVSYRRWQITI